METCPELQNLIAQMYAAETSGNLPETAMHHYTHLAGLLVIGSEPKAWHEDYSAIKSLYDATSGNIRNIKLVNIKSYYEGSVGWVIDQVIATLSNGSEIPVRHTYIFHQENSDWKIVHAHISVGISDEKLTK